MFMHNSKYRYKQPANYTVENACWGRILNIIATRLQNCVHNQNAKFLYFSSIPHSLNGDRLYTCAFQSPSRMHADNNVELVSSQYSPTDLANHVSIDTRCFVFLLTSSPPWSYAGISFRLAINAKTLHPGECTTILSKQVKFPSGSEKSLRRFISQLIRPEGP